MASKDRAANTSGGRKDDPAAARIEQDSQIAAAVSWLAEKGLLHPEKHARAAAMAEGTQERLDLVLVKLRLIDEEHLAQALSVACGLPLVREADFPPVSPFTDQLNTGYLRAQRVAPLRQGDETMLLVMADPFNHEAANAVRFKTGLRVNRAIGVGREIDGWLASSATRAGQDSATAAPDSREIGDADLQRLRDLAGGAPVVRWVDHLFETAVAQGASDIHLEPGERRLRVRLRIDGQLRDIPPPDPALSEAAVSRIKILCKLNMSERRLPQDGRSRITMQGREIDLRIATSPTLHGEGVVLRLLDRSASLLSLERLGLSAPTVEAIKRSIRRPNGITLVTGPTGSGKTTTLYAALLDILSPELKLVSVEDPIEYQVDGVSQIQVKPSIDLTFATALRSVLRQDPDVLMIGEIRDRETAAIAIEAALTGHQVLSTIHTNNAPATITRLLEMGVPEYLLASTLSSVSAQRLVRTLCPECSQPYEPPADLIRKLAGAAPVAAPAFRKPHGCTACRSTGYRGRSSIAEIMMISDAMRELILRRASESAIREQAIADGMTPLLADGFRRAACGETSIEDVIRVAGLD